MGKTYRGIVKGGAVVVMEDCAAPLPDGTYVEVTAMEPQPGDGAAIVAALQALPPVPEDVWEEFNRILEEAFPCTPEGKRALERRKRGKAS